MKTRSFLAVGLLLLSAAAQAITYADRSGTITLGGTSQTLAAANPGRGRIAVTNHPTETEVLCVNVTSAASCSTAGSWVLAPGETVILDSNELVTVVAATTGHKYTAKENITDGFAINVSGSTSISGGAGDASAANQVTGNNTLASIDTKTPALGQALAAGSVPVILPAATITTLTPLSTVAATQSGTWTARLQDGSGNAVTSAARGAERAVSVQIVDGSGAQVTTFGGSGGTASTVGSATPATATAVGGNDGTNMQVPRVADIDTGAGTQYALVTSPRLGASGGGVELVGGAGAVAAGVLRTTQASDSPLVSAAGATGDAAATAGSTGSISAKLRLMTTQLDTLNTSVNASTTQLPADGTGQVTMANSFPVAIASDQSNVPANVAQINGVTPLMGAGNTGTGSLRMTMVTDQAALATHGHGATGAAVPANVTAMGARAGANSVNVAQGSATVAVNVSTATTTQLVALSGSTQIYVTGLAVIAGGTGNITLVYGTGSSCGTGTTSLSGAIPLIANAGFTLGSGLGPVLVVPAGQALCITTSAAVQMSGFVTYTQF